MRPLARVIAQAIGERPASRVFVRRPTGATATDLAGLSPLATASPSAPDGSTIRASRSPARRACPSAASAPKAASPPASRRCSAHRRAGSAGTGPGRCRPRGAPRGCPNDGGHAGDRRGGGAVRAALDGRAHRAARRFVREHLSLAGRHRAAGLRAARRHLVRLGAPTASWDVLGDVRGGRARRVARLGADRAGRADRRRRSSPMSGCATRRCGTRSRNGRRPREHSPRCSSARTGSRRTTWCR